MKLDFHLKGDVLLLAVDKSERIKRIQELMNSIPVVDINVNINISKIQNLKEEKKFKCITCGDSFDVQKNKFSKSPSVLYQCNNNYINVCNSCRDNYYYQLIDLYSGSEEQAIKHMCMQFGWIYNLEALEASRQVSKDRSRISHYLAKKNLPQTTQYGYTDIDTVKNDYLNKKSETIKSKEHLGELKTLGVSNTSATSFDRWGGDLSDWDYSTLDEHYKMLKKNNPNCDNNQEIFIKALCNLNWLMMKALRNNEVDSDKYVKLTEQYSKTFKQAGLKTVEEKDSSNDEVLGVTLATISQYTPEEYYLNKELYKDYDNTGEYIDRHMLRPLKNLQLGSNDRDFEFFVPEMGEGFEEDEE